MGSYLTAQAAARQGDSDLHDWTGWAADATSLMRIGQNVFQSTNWGTASTRLSLKGINKTSPWSENNTYERLLWIRQDGPGFMTFRRSQCRLSLFGKSQLGVSLGRLVRNNNSPYTVDVPTTKIDDDDVLQHHAFVNIVVEMRTDGLIHRRQFGRLPFIGPYSDWQECLGFAIRLEFMTPRGLKCHYIQKKKDHYDGNVPTSYAEVSNLVAAFKGVTYNTTDQWRLNKILRPQRVVKVTFDNLNRNLQFEQLTQYQNQPEPTKKTFDQIGQELRNLGFLVSARKPNIAPQQGYGAWCRGIAASLVVRTWDKRARCDTCVAVSNSQAISD